MGDTRSNAKHRRALSQVHGPTDRPEAGDEKHDESDGGHSSAAVTEGAARVDEPGRALRRRGGRVPRRRGDQAPAHGQPTARVVRLVMDTCAA